MNKEPFVLEIPIICYFSKLPNKTKICESWRHFKSISNSCFLKPESLIQKHQLSLHQWLIFQFEQETAFSKKQAYAKPMLGNTLADCNQVSRMKKKLGYNNLIKFWNAYWEKIISAHGNQEFVDVFNGFQHFKCLLG